jgi:aspartyl-tRNA(Asn)/glutamyl-tRNA(Gln) amidotransferase subunit A
MTEVATDVALLAATELLRRYRTRELSPVEATEAALARIDRHDPTVNAFCLVDAERALADARGSANRWARAEPAGALDGVPVAVKDVFLTEGWPTLKGSMLVDAAQPWNVDAPIAASLRASGAVLVGKTTTPELGWKGVTDSPRHGITRNPWDPSRTAGGSSGGSSTAVVLGMATLATGTDGGGSVRIPAGFCGHPALKPTYGRIPHWPPSPYGTLAHVGPMARTVEDLALMLDVLAMPDPRDWTALAPLASSFLDGLSDGVGGLRIALSHDHGYVAVDDEVRDLVDRAAEAFEQLGAHVEAVDPGFSDPLAVFEVLWNSGAAAATSGYSDAQLDLLDPGLRRIVEDGRRYSAVDYAEAVRLRGELGVLMGEFHGRWDLLLTPTLPIPAFEAGRDVPPGWPDERWPTWTPFSYPYNLTQQPAASVPCGVTSSGLPAGLQIIGPRHADALVLRAAAAYEDARPLTIRPTMLGD